MRKLYLAIFVAVMLVVSAPAHALTFNLTSDHMDGEGGAGTPPFGTVTLSQVGTNVEITVSLLDGSQFVRTGAGGGFNFVFNGTGVALGDINDGSSNITAGDTETVGNNPAAGIQADGTGTWQFGVFFDNQGTGGANALSGPLDFFVADAVIADLTVGNGSNIFAVDMLSGQTENTGMVDVTGGATPVPEPISMLLLGTGLIGIASYARKNR